MAKIAPPRCNSKKITKNRSRRKSIAQTICCKIENARILMKQQIEHRTNQWMVLSGIILAIKMRV
jgi:hypothetical protein